MATDRTNSFLLRPRFEPTTDHKPRPRPRATAPYQSVLLSSPIKTPRRTGPYKERVASYDELRAFRWSDRPKMPERTTRLNPDQFLHCRRGRIVQRRLPEVPRVPSGSRSNWRASHSVHEYFKLLDERALDDCPFNDKQLGPSGR